ncbi:MAG: hypothetical protein K6G31_04485 [Paludibacteraceae bacterium]|nr:hypothetical protein [Paludibacteraceae bacterium]
MNSTSPNSITDDKFFTENYWDAVEHSNKKYIEKVAMHLDGDNLDGKRVKFEDLVDFDTED